MYERRFGGAGSSAAIVSVVGFADGGSHVRSGLGGGAGANAGANMGTVRGGDTSDTTITTASGRGGGGCGSSGSGDMGSGSGGSGGGVIVEAQISTILHQLLVLAGLQVEVTVE